MTVSHIKNEISRLLKEYELEDDIVIEVKEKKNG